MNEIRSMAHDVHVPLGERAYDVRIGPGLVARAGAEIADLLPRPRTWIVTEETVARLHLGTLRAGLSATGIEAAALILPPGEATKGWPHLIETVEWLLAEKVERRDLVIAFGGGVIGDLVGFACAVLRRGVRFVQVPTTLLAQVDSSVGGKTGINTTHGKNLVGAFHQPVRVLADIDVLGTLANATFLRATARLRSTGFSATRRSSRGSRPTVRRWRAGMPRSAPRRSAARCR
jgi:3-dehydroquinate synthase